MRELKLYGFWRSTATWRVRIALNLKGILFDYQAVDLRAEKNEQDGDSFRGVNPMRQVPVLEFVEHGAARRLTQSTAIIEYLDERYREPPLLPEDRFLRARARQVSQMVVSGIQPLQNTSVQAWIRHELRADERVWTHHWVERGLDAVEAVVAETSGKFCIGDAVTIADLCLVPQLHFARRYAVDIGKYPNLMRVEAACSEIEAFQGAHAERQPDADKA